LKISRYGRCSFFIIKLSKVLGGGMVEVKIKIDSYLRSVIRRCFRHMGHRLEYLEDDSRSSNNLFHRHISNRLSDEMDGPQRSRNFEVLWHLHCHICNPMEKPVQRFET